ncbi:uncharacterized protein LOC105434563 [Cucumis sativus]|uniref:uncharacterized protein LOC105434563 n=1 Tax=Cucumis sativus TaxID=3659 RepID=UPI0005ECE729|nr:uncharacterized protein LOC105434563 [Cucumis sativus]
MLFCKEEKELGRQQATGTCPSCGGKVQAVDVERRWRFCFVPLCFKIKRKYYCLICGRRLELYH